MVAGGFNCIYHIGDLIHVGFLSSEFSDKVVKQVLCEVYCVLIMVVYGHGIRSLCIVFVCV